MQFRCEIYDKIVTKRLHLHSHDYNSRMSCGQVISPLFHDFFPVFCWTIRGAAAILNPYVDFILSNPLSYSQKGCSLTQIMSGLPGIYTATKKDGSTYFRASVTYRTKHISLGSFATEDAASRTYREARMILDHPEITLAQYHLFSCISHEKFVCLLNFRDNGIYFKTPIYLCKKYFEYHMSATEILKFDRDDLFFYASKKIQKKGGYLFVSDYGSQYSILSRYGIRPFSVYGRDYRMANDDPLDFRYSNIEIINQYVGVQKKESASGQTVYQTKIHVNGDFIVGTYADEISAAIAYNKAADTLAAHGFRKAYARNYIVSMTNEQYHTAYTSISISKKLTAPAP